MRVLLACPAPVGSRLGNRVTAVRWQRLLSGLGHEARVTTALPRGRYDVLVALHAFKTADAVRWSRSRHPERRIVVALTGTDLYRDLGERPEARRSLELADRLIVLHSRAIREIPRAQRHKVRLIVQSAEPVRPPPGKASGFDVALVAHLRPEKDPFRAALATRELPADSRVRIVHAGRALDADMRRSARHEQAANPRYRWLGELAPVRARRLIARSRLLVLTSVSEGGANVLGEAVVSGVPVLASRIPASIAALGEGYPGLFPVGDTAALARLLRRAETDGVFLAQLVRETRARRAIFAPQRERSSWRALLRELSPAVTAGRRAAP